MDLTFLDVINGVHRIPVMHQKPKEAVNTKPRPKVDSYSQRVTIKNPGKYTFGF